MRIGPLRLNSRRAARALAGFVAAFLLTGNVLAAAGLCAVKVPAGTQESPVLMSSLGTVAEDTACADHLGDQAPASNPHHCPTEDPSAQSRTVDVPAAQLLVAAAAALLDWSGALLQREPPVVLAYPAEPQPIYTRLQRLHL
ncbi:MAG TPA: hypothetical protein VFX81_05485 [Burkholderiaceae bacterium]|nr:hypothetical protein [Burkholderiaceae bacterium]